MTAVVKQSPVLILADAEGKPRLSQSFVQILWGVQASSVVSQTPVLVLGRRKGRRTIGIID